MSRPTNFVLLQCGININSFIEEEESSGLLPPEANRNTYGIVRNAVLSLWRRDVSKRLELEEVLSQFRPAERPYALAAWTYLDSEFQRN